MTNFFQALLVDDDETLLKLTDLSLRDNGFSDVMTCSDSRDVLTILEVSDVGVILLDLTMPHLSGFDLLTAVLRDYPEVPVIVVTGSSDIQTAVECVKLGAFDYFVKPADMDRLILSIRRATELRDIRDEYESFRKRSQGGNLEDPSVFEKIFTNNERMLSCFRYVEAVSPSPKPVLITGETGTGKELLARAIHDASGRSGPFLAVNVAGFDDHLFSDSLFGHVKGAFTGADTKKDGLIEIASEGTLLLDEIGDLSLPSQAKLLRLIQEGDYLAVGANEFSRCRARIVVSTNRDLKKLQEEGGFRRDLYYRLCTHHVELPPLRDRLDDIPGLLSLFVEKACDEMGKPLPDMPKSLVTQLLGHTFPGNVRELEGLVYDAVTNLAEDNGLVLRGLDPNSSADGSKLSVSGKKSYKPLLYGLGEIPTLREAAAALIEEALERSDFDQGSAARLLGITRAALNKRLTRAKRVDIDQFESS